ncbi:uncharacterized protein LOC124677284 [Lolium rigidum]|uniref:uncharacterized protein LOC124677284 n=1 Tax=Lolium rigidum TaxID=89674 RepID=UPI001F5C3218|nr:uncharacterized protein LOC124677284 [Lolium rigidum]
MSPRMVYIKQLNPTQKVHSPQYSSSIAVASKKRDQIRDSEMKTQRNGLSFGTLLVMAFLLIAASQAVSVQGGRAMKEVVGSEAITANPLNPGSTPAVPAGQPYTRPGCTKPYGCNPPPAAATP